MNTPYPIDETPARLVYIRPVAVAELPDAVQLKLDSVEQIYAIHAPDGERLALVADQEQAFALARQNDFAPVGVH
ncbi:MAG: DUF1150 family protein [Pseudomonadota bacterium]